MAKKGAVKKFLGKKTHPAAGIPKSVRSRIVKKARKGKDIFHGGFQKVAAKAAKRYGSKEAGERVAAAQMWKMIKKRRG